MNPERTRTSRHSARSTELITREAAAFIARESGGQSLITVTRVILDKHGDRAHILVSVFPTEAGRSAVAFLSRLGGEFRTHLATHAKLHPLPIVDFALDGGEQNRQHLDEFTKKL